MTNHEILEKAIKKAIAGGWGLPYEAYDYIVLKDLRIDLSIVNEIEDNVGSWKMAYQELIYDHDFAKSLWGEEPAYGWSGDVVPAEPDETAEPMWQYHLQRMVIAPDPLVYLNQNI